MKLLLSLLTLIDGHRPPLQLAANDEVEGLLANASDGGGVFAILQGDSFFVPYGEYPHKTGLQVVDRTAAETMAANQKGMFRRVLGVLSGNSAGFPVYIGHPDLPGSKDTDKRSYGWISDIVPEETGVRFPVKWSEPGAELIENAHFKFYSPLWWHKPIGKGRVRPVALKSMGLTNDPNIPVPALANEAGEEVISDQLAVSSEESQTEPTENENDTMNPEILAALGLEEGATPETVLAKITDLKGAADAAANEHSELETAKADAETLKAEKLKAEEDKTAAENERDTIAAERDAALASLRVAANNAVQHAVTTGRITPAESETKLTEILAANDLEAALADLGKLPAKFKTASQTGDLGSAKSRLVIAANDESAAARDERARLVANEYESTNPTLSTGERKRIAWRRASAKRPDLFGKKEDSSGAAA